MYFNGRRRRRPVCQPKSVTSKQPTVSSWKTFLKTCHHNKMSSLSKYNSILNHYRVDYCCESCKSAPFFVVCCLFLSITYFVVIVESNIITKLTSTSQRQNGSILTSTSTITVHHIRVLTPTNCCRCCCCWYFYHQSNSGNKPTPMDCQRAVLRN